MRIVNRLLAFVVGLALAAAAVIAIVEIVVALSGRPPVLVARNRVASELGRLQWDDPRVVAVAVGMIVVGLLLLLVQLIPRRPIQLPLQGQPGRSAAIDRRGLQERLRHVALRDRDVVAAAVRVRRRAKLRVSVPGDADRRDARRRVHERVTDAVGQLGLRRPLKVKVAVVEARERTR